MSGKTRITEAALRALMKDDRYWTPSHPEYRAFTGWVGDGWKSLGASRTRTASGAAVVHVAGYERTRNGTVEKVREHSRSGREGEAATPVVAAPQGPAGRGGPAGGGGGAPISPGPGIPRRPDLLRPGDGGPLIPIFPRIPGGGLLRTPDRLAPGRAGGPAPPLEAGPRGGRSGTGGRGQGGRGGAAGGAGGDDDDRDETGPRRPAGTGPRTYAQLQRDGVVPRTPDPEAASRGRRMERIPGLSGKDKANDIPSWATRAGPPFVGETRDGYAGRLMDQQFPQGWYAGPRDTGSRSAFSQIRKSFRGYRIPRD